MAGYKETPRQKMIAMMYLVLTALLALNVSAEMLNAFLVVNDSISRTNEIFSRKIENTYDKFKIQYQMNPNKVGPYWSKAQQVQKLTADLVNYIDKIKLEVIAKSEWKTVDEIKNLPLRDIATKDKYDESTNYFIGNSQDGSAGMARKLKDKIIEYKTAIINLVEPQKRSSIKLGFDLEGPFLDPDGKHQTWEMHNFYHTILAADVTILNKIKAEAYNTEFDMVNYFYASVNAEDFKFDKIDAKIIPKSNYVLLGDKYEAEILVAAYDTKQNPEVVIEGRSIEGENGVVNYMAPASSEGVKKYKGVIKVKSPSGMDMNYPFENEYIVARPSLTVSATKMNVFYIGVENPVSISVPGIPDSKLTPTITAGSMKRDATGKDWLVMMPAGTTKATINVVADIDGSKKNMGSSDFRVKRIPNPEAEIAGQKDGSIDKATLLAANGIIPAMKDFLFDSYFEVISFTMASFIGGDFVPNNTKGSRFSPGMVQLIQKARSGQKFFFENINAKGPDGSIRTLNPVNLTIK